MTHIYDSVRTLRRRGANPASLRVWWSAVKRVWSARKHVSQVWLQIPVVLGGLGVEPWDGLTFPKQRWPTVDRTGMHITNSTGWRAARISEHYSKFLPITESEAEAISQLTMADKLASDDIPAVSSVLRKRATVPSSSGVLKQDVRWTIPGVERLRTSYKILAATPAAPDGLTAYSSVFEAASFGLFSHLARQWTDVALVFRIRKQTNLLAWFRDRNPDFYREIRRLEHRGLTRWEALDWTFGSTPIGITCQLHPALVGLLTRAVIYVVSGFIEGMKLAPKTLTQLVHVVTPVLEEAILHSDMSRRVYSW